MKIDHDKFLAACGNFNDHQRQGMDFLLTSFENDPELSVDVRWCAYALATTGHETGGTWQPVEEIGKGKGKAYGKPAGPYGLIYYGRGYPQNTWYENYLELTRCWNKLHTEEPADFVKNPELLLVPKYAYWSMSYGMVHGLFTGVGLHRYISGDECDYFNSRRIINGTDCAQKIADAAKWFDDTLRACLI